MVQMVCVYVCVKGLVNYEMLIQLLALVVTYY